MQQRVAKILHLFTQNRFKSMLPHSLRVSNISQQQKIKIINKNAY